MHLSGTQLVHSATDLSGFLACRHLTTLEVARARGDLRRPMFDDPGAEVLRQRGHEHESRILERYRAEGLTVAEPHQPTWEEGWSEDGWARCAAETLELMRAGVDVVYQACLFDGRRLGRPDFLRRVDRPSALGAWSYEVVDAKLSRRAKAGAVLQICFYSEMLGGVQGAPPERMHLALGRGALESFRCADFAAYYRSVKARFVAAASNGHHTYPEPCAHCTVCDWSSVCDRRLRDDDHLSLVAGITKRQRAALEERSIATLAELGIAPLPLEPRLDSVSPAAYGKIREQARLQLEGRTAGRPRYEILRDTEPGMGLAALPEPSPGDLFFDIEGDPHAFEDGLEYLLGWVDADGAFERIWALTPSEERRAFERFVDLVVERLERWPGLHVYHFGHYETTRLKRLASRYATREDEVDRLLRGGVLVDLHRVMRQGVRASVESYSIKKLEPLYGFERGVELRVASSALANFEAWLQLGGAGRAEARALLDDIERYNRDDCISTLRLRDWLEERRAELADAMRADGALEGALPRPVPPDPGASENVQEESERVQALMDRLLDSVPDDPAERDDAHRARWTLAYLLSWHRREEKSTWWEYYRLRELAEDELLLDAKALAGLEYEGEVGQVKRSIVHRYRFPPQDFGIRRRDEPHDPRTGKPAGSLVAVDAEHGTIDLKRGKGSEVPHPRALIPYEIFRDGVLRESLQRLADDVVTHGLDDARNRAAVDMLLRHPPRAGQAAGEALRRPSETSLDAARRIAPALDRTVLPIQGPPGSGKTYIGARMVVELVRQGRRVGVTANSHKVIVNLLDKICEAADEAGVAVRGMQKAKPARGCQDERIECKDDNAKVEQAVAEGDVDLVAGTVWLWAREKMQGTVDVLLVDEAGQMSLANALAASGAAESLVLIGDPQQLEQPQKGVHPPGTDAAALEHLVGADTLAADRGLFLDETWRLHPDVCAFTSELYYEGKLTARPELVVQTVQGPEPFDGVGLRLWPVEHEGNTNESPEEVEAVAELVGRLLESGATWVNDKGVRSGIGPEQVLVVAPYNAQVGALRAALPDGVPVGTVDKFQGQEAPIVIYSTASSSAQDAPRGMEFLFSPNRLNVATSRARCVVVWVGSTGLLGPDCSSVRQMRLANGFCRLGEMGGG